MTELPNKLMINLGPMLGKVYVHGIEITSKEDWDNVILKVAHSIRENERLREALISARHILLVENLLEVWPENAKKIDEALLNKELE